MFIKDEVGAPTSDIELERRAVSLLCLGAYSSVVERISDKDEVEGSIPSTPTLCSPRHPTGRPIE